MDNFDPVKVLGQNIARIENAAKANDENLRKVQKYLTQWIENLDSLLFAVVMASVNDGKVEFTEESVTKTKEQIAEIKKRIIIYREEVAKKQAKEGEVVKNGKSGKKRSN